MNKSYNKIKYVKNVIFKSKKGTSAIIFALLFTIITTSAAFTIDVGIIVIEKAKLSAAVDSAALAGVQEVLAQTPNVEAVVENYIQENIGAPQQLNLTINDSEHAVTINVTKTVQTYFAKILGKDFQDISVTVKAKAENISSLTGARPLAIGKQDFVYGQLYTLKESGGDGTNGNYDPISLGGNGASVYEDNLLNGYSGTICVDDKIKTETGNMSGSTISAINQLLSGCTHTPACTYLYYNKNCSKIICIPVATHEEIDGKKHIKVLGFATFFLEGAVMEGGQADIQGRFITYCMDGQTSTTIDDYGTYGLKLVN